MVKTPPIKVVILGMVKNGIVLTTVAEGAHPCLRGRFARPLDHFSFSSEPEVALKRAQERP